MKFNYFGALWRIIFLALPIFVSFLLDAMDATPAGAPLTPPFTPDVSAQNSPRLKRALEQELLPFSLDEPPSHIKLQRIFAGNRLTPQQIAALNLAHAQGISVRKKPLNLPQNVEDTPLEDLNASQEDSMDTD